ncbi:DUF1851 domain-containing protein [Paracoccus sp. 11-3]|uniref:DUF1851 domain-containing protein n=1 Tax=Paracoccus amoyensis TaxID=2760093 RepID=A0A926GCZ6_9RHOB|nr:GAD-like domain-containing protein [Paracoccus amoyensis]MBC9245134.1 DUF1851 domain-containing protein [Paracoccus amoyensis]
MSAYTDEDWYSDLVKEYAPPAFQTFPTEEQIAYWRGRVPEMLMRWWIEEGWGSLNSGKYWVCDPGQLRPVIEEIFADDPDYHPDDLIPFGYNALGVINVAMGQGRSMKIDLGFGIVTWRGPQAEYPQSEFVGVYYSGIATGAHRLEAKDENGVEIFPWALEHLGPLEPYQIYGFVPAYSVTGNYPVKNLQKLSVVERLVTLAALSRPTLYDYVRPEGAQGGFGTLVPLRKVGPQP